MLSNIRALKSWRVGVGRFLSGDASLSAILEFFPNKSSTCRSLSSTAAEASAEESTFKSTSSTKPTLYQYAICPYCNITKSLLHYTKTPYDAVEVNPLTKAELKSLPDKDYKKVPILMVSNNQQQINGSDVIVDYLLKSKPSNTGSVLDTTSESSQKWATFARDDLAPLLYPNLCNTLSNSIKAFAYVHHPTSTFSIVQRYSIQTIGSFAMYMAAQKIKKKRNITDEVQALEEALKTVQEALQEQNQKQQSSSFLSGTSEPHLGDLTIYGVLRGLKGLPVMKDIVLNDKPEIQKWFGAMENVVEDPSPEQ